ncbi:MAG: polysaccharide deacetylase family protein [Elusimicrobiaceae bacterium]|nr:polysaccharide deacetylase family protein [Elusimicrobiaceae bacterium]
MIALKVDIDTREGLKNGLPALLDFFREQGIKASFYVSFGPDESGKAVRRIFTKKGFLKKMFRTNAARLYGFKTMLYGTVLPAPLVGAGFPELARRITAEGHEAGVHAWSHVRWQDGLDGLSPAEINQELDRAIKVYRDIYGADPAGFAAPAWKINVKALEALGKKGFKYLSIGRGPEPALPSLENVALAIPEIPTTLPTLDEILAWDGADRAFALSSLASLPGRDRLNVYTLHTEAEGSAYLPFFKELTAAWRGRGFSFVRLDETAAKLDLETLPSRPYTQGELAGRAGAVALVTDFGRAAV